MKRMTALFAAAMGFAAVALAENQTVNGINWTYRIVAGIEAQIVNNNNVCIDTSTSGAITVPSTLGGKPVTKIGCRAFQGCTKLTKITIPSSVVFIDTYAFYNCTGLTEVVVPDSVSNCGNGDWFDCDNGKTLKLQKLTIPAAAAAVDLFGSTAIPSGLEVKTKVTSGGKTFAVKCGNLGKDSTRFAEIGHGESAAIDTATSGTVAVPGTVTVLGKSCTVKYIADHAFAYCTGLTGVTLPESVKWIEDAAFVGCTSMASITTPGVTSIGTMAFWNCDALTEVNLPVKLSMIGVEAFNSCDSLRKVNIRRGATTISARAFRNCSSLASLTIGEGTVEICSNAFKNCELLGSVTLPDTVTRLEHDAFNGCDGLWFASLPKHFYSGSFALPRSEFALIFSNCHPDLEIVFMENGVAAGISLLNDRFWYYRIYDSGSGKVVLLQNNGPNNLAVYPTPTGVLTIPSKFATRSVTDIGAQAFYGCTGLTGVNFPSGLKTIGNYAFYGCNRLSSVEIPNGVTSIGKGAFEDCSALENLIIPDGLAGWSSVGDDAFKNCTRLSLVRAPGAFWNWPVGSSAPLTRVFPGHTSLFTNKSFYYVFDNYFQQWGDDSNVWKFTLVNGTIAKIVGASGLATKTVPVQLGGCPVSLIGEGAFKGSTGTKNFIIPANCNVTRIDDSAFENSGITNIDIRSSVTYLGTAVFKGCAALETATLPGTVTELPMDAFYGCANLAWVEATPDEIGDFAFYDCPALDSSAVNYIISYAETIGTAAFACLEPAVRTGQLEVPDDTTSIGDYAFSAAGFTGGASLPGALAGAIDESTVFYGWTSSMPIIYRFANGVFAETVDSIVWRYTVDAYGNATLVGATMQAGTLYTGAFPSVLGGHPVTAIAAGAFENDTVLRYVTIPASVTTIGANAFKGANANPLTSNLRDIRIQGGVTNICANAFAYTELGRGGAQLYIPDSVRSIDTGAFSHCPYLARVSLPERFYPDRARMTSDVFAGCSSDLQITYRITNGDVMSQTINGTTWYIEKSGDTVKLRGMEVRNVPTGVLPAADPRPEGALVIPDKVCGYTVNTIGSWAFGYCNLISSVTIPDTITKIEEKAFYGCSCLESVSIPRSVTTIEDYAFDQCFGLATANLPDTLLGRIDESKVFRGCAEVVAGGIAVTYFGEGEVRGVTYNGMSWTYRVLDEALHTAKLVPYNGNPAVTPAPTSTLTIPSTLGGYTIVEIGEKSFYECSGLTGVVIPSTVATIGKSAFLDTGLTAVTLPSSVETIKEYAFFRCTSLASASFTSGLTRIERYAFCNCESLGNVDLPASLTYIGDHAFDNCDSFTEFAIPANVLYLGEESLYGCRAITNLYVASQAIFDESSMVMYNAFGSDRQLVTLSVTLAPGITTIPQAAFEGFEKMASVSIPDTVTKIEKYAFWECKALTEVVIPESVTEFGDGVFLSCINLERVTLPAGMTAIPNNMFRMTGLNSVRVPDGVTTIGTNAYSHCNGYYGIGDPSENPKLTSVYLPDGVTTIMEQAFYADYSLAEVRIPRSVTSIENEAFGNCDDLSTVRVASRDTARVKALFVASGLTQEYVDGLTFIEEDPDLWHIEFDAAGGLCAVSHIEREPDAALGELPVPAREGYGFAGWFTEPDGEGTQVTAATLATGDVTYYANWTRNSHEIYFNAGTGFGYSFYFDVEEGRSIAERGIDIDPVGPPEGYVFKGWFNIDDDAPVDVDAPVTEPAIYYAKWAKELDIGLVKVIDGVADATAYSTESALSGDPMTLPAAPAIDGKTFIGWSVSLDSELMSAGAEFVPDDDTDTLYANYERTVWDGNLATLTGDATAEDGTVIYGTLAGQYKISIADGAKVTLNNAIITNGLDDSSYSWAGITCLGDAEIVLAPGTVNVVKGFFYEYPGIYVPVGSTLTIGGSGSLTASSNGFGAGIGAGYGQTASGVPIPCGNIRIEGGTIAAVGGGRCAGIGGGNRGSTCGDIEILGGTITATGGDYGAGIGGGDVGSCGDITIGAGVTRVVATAGAGYGTQPIGGGDDAVSCGYVTVDPSLTDDRGSPTRTITGGGSSSDYTEWATENGVSGAWDAVDASGVANVFRYAFDKPTGPFTEPPMLDITFNAEGKAVVKTPPLVNTTGFTFTIEASDAPDGTGNAASYQLNDSGETTIDETGKARRFFRLRAVAQ